MLEKRIETIRKGMENEEPVSKIKELFVNYLISYMKLKDQKHIEPTKKDIENYSNLFHDYLEYCNRRVRKE